MNVKLFTVFGGAGRGEPDPQSLDIGVLSEHSADFGLRGFITEVIEFVGLEQGSVTSAGPSIVIHVHPIEVDYDVLTGCCSLSSLRVLV